MKRTFPALAILFCAFVLNGSAVHAVPVTINGFVADLTGVPHDRPEIVIRVRSVQTGREIAAVQANANGSFSIPIDPATVPDVNVALSITASGTAFINGQQVAVRTNGTLLGLAGEIADGLIPNPPARVEQFILLTVPKAQSECGRCSPCDFSYSYRGRWRTRCR